MKDFEEREEELEEDFASGGATVKAHRIGRIFKIIFYIFVYSIMAFLILRMCTNGEPAEIDKLIVNKPMAEAYRNDGKLECFYQKYDEYTVDEENYGYFGITKTVIIPKIEQIQIVFRYNRSTLEYLPIDYPELCPEVPSRDEVLYDISLVKVIDLTPDNTEDNDDKNFLKYERYFPTADATVSMQKGLHNYFRYVFEGVTTEDALEIYIDIYYNKDIDYEEDAYGSVRVFSAERYTHTYSLTARDKRALKKFEKE